MDRWRQDQAPEETAPRGRGSEAERFPCLAEPLFPPQTPAGPMVGAQNVFADVRQFPAVEFGSTHGRTDVVFALAVVTVGGGETLDVRNRFDVPYDDAGDHAIYSTAQR